MKIKSVHGSSLLVRRERKFRNTHNSLVKQLNLFQEGNFAFFIVNCTSFFIKKSIFLSVAARNKQPFVWTSWKLVSLLERFRNGFSLPRVRYISLKSNSPMKPIFQRMACLQQLVIGLFPRGNSTPITRPRQDLSTCTHTQRKLLSQQNRKKVKNKTVQQGNENKNPQSSWHYQWIRFAGITLH